jgi:hypothetical protein
MRAVATLGPLGFVLSARHVVSQDFGGQQLGRRVHGGHCFNGIRVRRSLTVRTSDLLRTVGHALNLVAFPVGRWSSPLSCCDKIRRNSCGVPAMNVTVPSWTFLGGRLLGQNRAIDGTQAGKIGPSIIALREQRKATDH